MYTSSQIRERIKFLFSKESPRTVREWLDTLVELRVTKEMLQYRVSEAETSRGCCFKLYQLIEEAQDLTMLKESADRVMKHHREQTGYEYHPDYTCQEIYHGK